MSPTAASPTAYGSLKERIDKLSEAIEGNGKPGLKADMAKTAAEVTTIRESVKILFDEQRRTSETAVSLQANMQGIGRNLDALKVDSTCTKNDIVSLKTDIAVLKVSIETVYKLLKNYGWIIILVALFGQGAKDMVMKILSPVSAPVTEAVKHAFDPGKKSE